MPRRRSPRNLSEVEIDQLSRYLWLLTAVSRLGSVGSYLPEAEKLAAKGLLTLEGGSKATLTPEGERIVERSTAMRGR
jgi:hypothetical protein